MKRGVVTSKIIRVQAGDQFITGIMEGASPYIVHLAMSAWVLRPRKWEASRPSPNDILGKRQMLSKDITIMIPLKATCSFINFFLDSSNNLLLVCRTLYIVCS